MTDAYEFSAMCDVAVPPSRGADLVSKIGEGEIARGSALGCASIREVLWVCDAIDVELNHRSKSELRRIVSMLTRWIRRTRTDRPEGSGYIVQQIGVGKAACYACTLRRQFAWPHSTVQPQDVRRDHGWLE